MIQLLNEHPAKRVLILPPDYTRYHSKAGFLTNVCYHYYADRGAEVDILPTLGTHRAMTRAEALEMFGDVPFERVIVHNWRTDVVKIGEVPGFAPRYDMGTHVAALVQDAIARGELTPQQIEASWQRLTRLRARLHPALPLAGNLPGGD